MPPIVFRRFGGERPVYSGVRLPRGAAQMAEGVDFRSAVLSPGGEFQRMKLARPAGNDWRGTASITPRLLNGGATLDEQEWEDRTNWIIYGNRVVVSRGGAAVADNRSPRVLDENGSISRLGFRRREGVQIRVDNDTPIFRRVGDTEANGLRWDFGITLIDKLGYESALITDKAEDNGFVSTVGGRVGVNFRLAGAGLPTDEETPRKWRLYATRGSNWWLLEEFVFSDEERRGDAAVLLTDVMAVDLDKFARSTISDTGEIGDPPADEIYGYLSGISLLESGYGVGYVNIRNGQDVRGYLVFSSRYKLAQWPVRWRYAVDFQISDLVIYRNMVYVFGLNRRPLVVVVNNPAAPSINDIPGNHIYIGGAARVMDMVVYACPAGIAAVSGQLMTDNVLVERNMQDFNPRYALALEDDYYLFGSGGCWRFDWRAKTGGSVPEMSRMRYANSHSGYVVNQRIRILGFDDRGDNAVLQHNEYGSGYCWRSRRVRLPRPQAFRAVRVDYDNNLRFFCEETKGIYGVRQGETDTEFSLVRRGGGAALEGGDFTEPLSALEQDCVVPTAFLDIRVFNFNGGEEQEIDFNYTPKPEGEPQSKALTLEMMRDYRFGGGSRYPNVPMNQCARAQDYEIEIVGNLPLTQVALLTEFSEADVIPHQENQAI